MHLNLFKKYLFIFFGCLSFALGMLGIVLPVLPTTPFLLLASFCFMRSSKRLYQWLIHHRIVGSYLYHYITYRAVLRSTKIGALLFLWLCLIISILLTDHLYAAIILVIVGIGVSIHLLSLKTLKIEEMIAMKDDQERE